MRKFIRILIIICILVLAGIALFFLSPAGQTYIIVNYINDTSRFNSETKTVGNVSEVFSIYKGDMDSIILDKSAYNFANFLIPEYYKIENVNEYYEKNKKIIEKFTRISTFEEFNKLVQKIKELKGDNLVLEKYMICENSTKDKINAITTVLAVQYKNNDKILFELEITNDVEKNVIPIKYKAIENGEYDITRDETVIDTEIHTEKATGRVR